MEEESHVYHREERHGLIHKEDKPKPKHRPKKEKMGFTDKLFIFLLIICAAYVAYIYFQNEIIKILQMNPYVWSVFSHIIGEISKTTLAGLFYASFFGALFFILLPIELLFLYYLTLGYSMPFLIALTMIGYLLGLCLDYLFGFVVGARIVKFFLGEKFDKFHNTVSKWGGIAVFFGNVIIFPIQPVSVVLGTARYSFKKFFILSILGLFIKLLLLVTLNTYFGHHLTPFLEGFG